MTLSSRQVLEIIRDEKEFVGHTSPSSNMDKKELKFISIPKLSFTAFRLSHTSPIELSLCSKVVLLGGIPAQWLRDRSNVFWKATSHISSRKMQKNANRVLNHGYRNYYRRGKSEIRRVVSGESEWRDAEEPGSLQKQSRPMASPTDLCKEKSQTMAVIPSVHSVNDKKNLRSPALRHRNTIAAPLNSGVNEHEQGSSAEEDHQEMGYKGILAGRRRSESQHTSKTLESLLSLEDDKKLERLQRPCSDGNSEDRFSTCRTHEHADEAQDETEEDSLNIHEEMKDPEPLRTIRLEATRSETIPENSVFDKPSTAQSTPLSFVDSLSLTNTESRKGQDNVTRIRFVDADQSDSPQAMRKAEKRRTIRLKPTRNSSDAEPLLLIAAEPFKVDDPDKQIFKKHFKIERLAVKRVGHVGKNVRIRMERGVSNIIENKTFKMTPLFKNIKCGEIIRIEKMLVMVKTAVNKKDPVPCFTQDEPFDTRVSERWKEYIVVARSTGKADSSLLLQFYHHRQVPKKQNKQKAIAYGSSLDFKINHKCQVGIYNSLDKTICIQRPDNRIRERQNKRGIRETDVDLLKIYIFKCGTLISSGKWYSLLQSATGRPQTFENVKFEIPEANIAVDMRFGGDLVKNLLHIEAAEKDWLRICNLKRGYRVLQHPLMRYITIAAFEELRKAGLHELLEKWESANVVLGCDYRQYDMLRWCSSNKSNILTETLSIFTSHLLEYRPYVPSPREVRHVNGPPLAEPVPIEGFLVRLTNKYGLERNKMRGFRFKPSYFFTSDSLLFFMSYHKSTPPLPSELTELTSKELLQRKKLLTSLPLVYELDPYPIDLNSHISWLNDEMSQDEFIPRDLYAFNSFNRRVLQILRAEGMIDLKNIVRVYQGSPDDYQGLEVKYQFLHLGRHTFWRKERGELQDTAASILYLETTNKLLLKLMAPDPSTCHEWKIRLEALVKYWQLKEETDVEKIWHLKMQNLRRLKLTEEEESNINEATPRWVTNRGLTDTTIYNVNALCELRPLLYKGTLYQKPKKHATFSKYMVVLIPGFLLLYNCFHRSTTGFAQEIIDYRHYLTISIADCYIYSGTTTKLDLLARNGKVDELNAGSVTLPRAYSDGWTSSEEESMRCFTLWFGKKRAMFNGAERAKVNIPNEPRTKDEKTNLEKNSNPFRVVSRLGVSGKSMVFMARSRQEKNLWVLSIHYELERLRQHDGG